MDYYRELMLEVGLKLWRSDPTKISTRNIAKMIGKSHVTVFNKFPNGVRKAIAAHGVAKGDSVVIVSLMLINDPLVANLSEEEREKHLQAVRSIEVKDDHTIPSAK